jgi:hypothetical protein
LPTMMSFNYLLLKLELDIANDAPLNSKATLGGLEQLKV